jgi:hypothetical protein
MEDKVNKSLETQIAKYGGVEGYRAEMTRRRALVKSPGFKSMDREKLLAAARLGGLNSRKNKHGKQTEKGSRPR